MTDVPFTKARVMVEILGLKVQRKSHGYTELFIDNLVYREWFDGRLVIMDSYDANLQHQLVWFIGTSTKLYNVIDSEFNPVRVAAPTNFNNMGGFILSRLKETYELHTDKNGNVYSYFFDKHRNDISFAKLGTCLGKLKKVRWD